MLWMQFLYFGLFYPIFRLPTVVLIVMINGPLADQYIFPWHNVVDLSPSLLSLCNWSLRLIPCSRRSLSLLLYHLFLGLPSFFVLRKCVICFENPWLIIIYIICIHDTKYTKFHFDRTLESWEKQWVEVNRELWRKKWYCVTVT